MTYGLAGAALFILIGLLATSFWMFERSRAVSDELLEAREQRGALFRLLLTLQEAESGQRGYLITKEQSYLVPYMGAKQLVDERITDVRSAYAHRPIAFEAVEKLIQEKLAELATTIARFDEGRPDEAIALVKSDRGQLLMDDLRTRIYAFVDEADTRLGESASEQVRIADQTRTFTTFAAALILAAALGAIVTILKYTRELSDARTNLQNANASLELRVQERTAELQRANEEIQRFAYIVSHDLRSPLVNVMGFTSELEASLKSLSTVAGDPELVKLTGGPEAKTAIETEVPEAIDFIRRSTAKMDHLIKAILKLSREGERVLARERVDLADVFASLAANVQHRLTDVGGELHIHKPLSTVHTDRLALEQIFGNLIDNAIKYRRPDVPLHIAVRETPGYSGLCSISIEDNGRGIAPEDHERIFDLFRRAGSQDQPGEGIGLAHVRALVRRLGGTISVKSTLGKGTTFQVMLNRQLPSGERNV